MDSDPVTVVANSVHRHDQSIDLGIMIQTLPYDLTEMRRRSVMLVIHLSSCLKRNIPLECWQFIMHNVGVNITCQTLRKYVRTN